MPSNRITDARLSVAANAIGYELNKDKRLGDDGVVWVTDAEIARARVIAERVLKDLDEFDQGVSTNA